MVSFEELAFLRRYILLTLFFFEVESLPVALNSDDHPASVLQELGFQIAWPIQKGLTFHETF